jgi:hypothetical protein
MAYVFGCTTGTTLTSTASGVVVGSLWSCSTTTTIRSLYIWAAFDSNPSRKVTMGIYNSSGTLLGTTYELDGTGIGTGTWGIDLQSQVAVSSGQDYWLMVHMGATFSIGRYFALLNSEDCLDNTGTYSGGSMPSPLPSDLDNLTDRDYDIYADDTWINPPTEFTADAAIEVGQTGSITVDARISVEDITSAALLSVL